VIVKKLSAVETLGGTSVICTDKTGTLTENRIEVHKLILPDENPVAGIKELFPPEPGFNYMKLQLISVLCNTAELIFNGETSKESGDPLETGLLKFAHKGGINIAETRAKFPKIDEEPFTSETRMMATLHRSEDSYFIAAKGAVEELLEKCSFVSGEEKAIPMDENQKQYWSGEAAKLAKSGLRVIAAAFREIKMQPEKITDQLSFAGLFGLLDPPREEVFDAIRECKSAGIDVIMVTGDHPATARTIGHELGLVEAGEDEVIPGKEMVPYSKLDENEKRRWRNAKIFARVSPAQKFDLIRVLQEKGEVVAMTGDGVNDAPALKKADIGIAMGVRGTQVAQEAAAMVLQDDSFASIVVAIRQGRIIFDNIRKFVIYLLSCNLSELLVIAVTAIAGLHFSLFPLQILYLNLLTDVFPALALGITPGSKSVMNHKPRRPDQPVIQRQNWFAIFIYAFIISACTLGAVWFSQEIVHAHKQLSSIQNNNILFLTLLLSQLWHVFNMTEEIKLPLYKSDVFRNKYAWFGIIFCIILVIISWMIPGTANALSLQSLSFADLLAPLTCSLVSFAVIRLLRKLKVVK
ncbi:MAG TPA: cation-translocating P-type ATPase, partial [Bacteroidia bacterium]|nr:cation-translocating P-type ATPase [Bacteroidia bacterium]